MAFRWRCGRFSHLQQPARLCIGAQNRRRAHVIITPAPTPKLLRTAYMMFFGNPAYPGWRVALPGAAEAVHGLPLSPTPSASRHDPR